MMLKCTANHLPPREVRRRICIASFFLAFPWLLPQWIFCSDPSPWLYYLFGYRVIEFVEIATATIVILCMWVENRWRGRNGLPPFPAISCTAGFFMATFFIPGLVLSPLLSHFPRACLVSQTAKWETPRGTFFLVLEGRGTEADHEFTNGYLNYSGDAVAGFRGIRFHPIQFQNDYFEDYEVGTEALLERRLENDELKGVDLERLSHDIWKVLNSAGRGEKLRVALGTLDTLKCGVDPNISWMAGGSLWSVLLLVAFQVVGRLSLSK